MVPVRAVVLERFPFAVLELFNVPETTKPDHTREGRYLLLLSTVIIDLVYHESALVFTQKLIVPTVSVDIAKGVRGRYPEDFNGIVPPV